MPPQSDWFCSIKYWRNGWHKLLKRLSIESLLIPTTNSSRGPQVHDDNNHIVKICWTSLRPVLNRSQTCLVFVSNNCVIVFGKTECHLFFYCQRKESQRYFFFNHSYLVDFWLQISPYCLGLNYASEARKGIHCRRYTPPSVHNLFVPANKCLPLTNLNIETYKN